MELKWHSVNPAPWLSHLGAGRSLQDISQSPWKPLNKSGGVVQMFRKAIMSLPLNSAKVHICLAGVRFSGLFVFLFLMSYNIGTYISDFCTKIHKIYSTWFYDPHIFVATKHWQYLLLVWIGNAANPVMKASGRGTAALMAPNGTDNTL